jgi:hypothetical protein
MENESERLRRQVVEQHEAAVRRGDIIEGDNGTFFIRHTYWTQQLQQTISLQDEVMGHMRKEIKRLQRFIDGHLPQN